MRTIRTSPVRLTDSADIELTPEPGPGCGDSTAVLHADRDRGRWRFRYTGPASTLATIRAAAGSPPTTSGSGSVLEHASVTWRVTVDNGRPVSRVEKWAGTPAGPDTGEADPVAAILGCFVACCVTLAVDLAGPAPAPASASGVHRIGMAGAGAVAVTMAWAWPALAAAVAGGGTLAVLAAAATVTLTAAFVLATVTAWTAPGTTRRR